MDFHKDLTMLSSAELVEYANARRIEIVPPSQSYFRVVCLLVVSILDEEKSEVEESRKIILIEGHNCEQGFIGGAICGERAAITQLRRYKSPKIVKIVITTDSEIPISSGCLCREFLLSYCDVETPSIMSDATGAHIYECSIGSLYPSPYIYRHCQRHEIEPFAMAFTEKYGGVAGLRAEVARLCPEDDRVISLYDKALETTTKDRFNSIHPIKLAAGILFSTGRIETCWQLKALEYGSTLDPVSQLLVIMERVCDLQKESPQYIICVDQFGTIHAPFAQARSLLCEHGYGGVKILSQREEGGQIVLVINNASDLVPTLQLGSGLCGTLSETVFK